MSKTEMIAEIKEIIATYGATDTNELKAETSPVVNPLSDSGISERAEGFNMTGVDTVVYHKDVEIARGFMRYELLSDSCIEQTHALLKQYEITQIEERW